MLSLILSISEDKKVAYMPAIAVIVVLDADVLYLLRVLRDICACDALVPRAVVVCSICVCACICVFPLFCPFSAF